MIGAIAIAFVMSPFLVNTLGDTKYGIWSVMAALTGYMTLFDLGISSAVAKYVSRYKALNDYQSINRIFSSALVLLVIVGIILVSTSPFIASFVVRVFKIEPELRDVVYKLVMIGSIDVAVYVGSGVFLGSFYGFQKNEIVNGVILFIAIFRAIFWYLALTSGFDLLSMGIISLVGNTLAIFLLWYILNRTEPQVEVTTKYANKTTTASIFNYSKFTFITMLGMQLIYYSDAFVIGYFLTAAAITIYTIPWSLSEYSNKMILAVAQTFVPVFSEQEATEDKALYNTYISGTKAVLVLSNLLCIGMLVLGDHFIGIWMGPRYAVECGTLLLIMFTTQLIKSPQLLSYSVLLGTSNHQRFSTYNLLFSFANLILSIFLVQKYVLFYAIVTPILTSRVMNFSLFDYVKSTYLRIIPASILLFVILKYPYLTNPSVHELENLPVN